MTTRNQWMTVQLENKHFCWRCGKSLESYIVNSYFDEQTGELVVVRSKRCKEVKRFLGIIPIRCWKYSRPPIHY